LQGVRIPSAVLKIIFRHLLFYFLFFNAVWALMSGGFCIVFNTLVISTALEVMKIFLLFYMCHFAMGLTHCYKTAVFTHILYLQFFD